MPGNSPRRRTRSWGPISAITGPYGAHWIGLTDTAVEGTFRWTDGRPVVFSSWWSGEPNDWGGNEDCAGNNFGATGYWNDWDCNTHLPFACQR